MGITKRIPQMNLDQIASSGQCFRWEKIADDTYVIPGLRAGNSYIPDLTVSGKGEEFLFSCSEADWDSHWNSPYHIYPKSGRKNHSRNNKKLLRFY